MLDLRTSAMLFKSLVVVVVAAVGISWSEAFALELVLASELRGKLQKQARDLPLLLAKNQTKCQR
jgi:hypothetical protein